MRFPVDKALRAPLVFLSGDEDLVRKRALNEILESVGEDAVAEAERFEGGNSPPMEWFGAAMTAPFLADRRLVIVRRLLRQKCDVAIPNLPATAMLVLVADEEPGDDDKRNRANKFRTDWEKAVEAAGGYVLKGVTDPKELRAVLRDEVNTLGKRISAQSVELLVEMTGGSLTRAMEELQKAALFAGDAELISDAHVRAVVVPSREWNVYHLVDAILSGRTGDAMRQMRVLVSASAKVEDPLYGRVFPEISRQLKLAWQARQCIDANVVPPNVPDGLKEKLLSKPNILSLKDFQVKQYMRLARRVSYSQMAECFQALVDAESEMKGALPSFTALDSAERMVVRMATATSNR